MTCRRPATTVRVSFPRISVCALGLLLLLFGFGGISHAQSGAASISGTITDRSGALVPEAAVSVVNTDTDSKFETKTNGAGVYQVPFLKPGHYRIVVTKQGFKQVDVRDVTLNVQDSVNRNFTLDIGATSETVQVNGSGINMNTTDAAVSTVIDRQFVANMPLNGRSLQDLETLVPGVAIVASGGPGVSGELTVNGQRTEANSFSVDGVNANVGTGPGYFSIGAGFSGNTPTETALGTTQSMVSVDALQEFRATTSTYSAEYGRTPGGQFSFTTRSGTNDWHGSAFDYFRNEALDANNWFNSAATPQVSREKERQNDFGGTLGGPVRIPQLYNGRDKTFFFFSYEGLKLWVPQGLLTSSVPDQTLRQQAPAALQPVLNAFPLPNKGEDGLNDGLGIFQIGLSYPSSIDSTSVRVDHIVNDKFKIFGRYADTPSVTSAYFSAQKTNSIINSRLITLGATNIVNSSQANELRFNITQVKSNSQGVSTNLGGATPFDITTLPGASGSSFPAVGSSFQFCLCFGGYPNLNIGEATDTQKQYNVTDSYSWAVNQHSLKFGIDWRRISTYARPALFQFNNFPSEEAILANNVGMSGSLTTQSQSPVPVEPLYKNFSAFAQDEWRVAARLSLSLGLRWDVNPAPGNLTGPSPYTLNQTTNLSTTQLAPEGTPLWKTDWKGFAPRVGAAYRLRQSPGQETVLRTGFGMFYDTGNLQGSTGYGNIGFVSVASYSDVSFPLTSAQMTLPPPTIAPPYNDPVNAFDSDLRLPYTMQWNLALEQALGSQQALTLTYIGSSGRRLLETYQVFPAGNSNFGPGGGQGVYITKNGPTSSYNGLQVQFQRRLSHGLQSLASYTFSHSIDDASSNFNLSDLLERASSDFDIRHNLQAALTYDVPGQYSNAVLASLLNHWALDARVTARSAQTIDIIGRQYVHEVGTGPSVNYHPNLVPGQALYLYGSQYPGGRIINYDAFTIPTSGAGFDSEGDTPRNYARGFGAWQLNLAVRREFPIHEHLHLQFRAEAFNIFNHPAFSGIYGNWSYGPYDPQFLFGFGGATSTLNSSLGGLNSLYQTGGPRSLQIALKLIF
jgi:hypothetical protein